MPRVAFADLLFSWPPNGGADIDLHHVLQGLQASGVEVCLFYAGIEGADDRGIVDEEQLPYPAKRVPFALGEFTPANLAARFRAAVDSFQPNAVLATHAFAMKPYLLEALSYYPLASRYYAHELTCARDPRRYKDEAPCLNNYLDTPDACRVCALTSQQPFISTGNHRAWTADYLAAQAYAPAHHARTLQSLARARALVVYNRGLRADLLAHHPNVKVIPGGANVSRIEASPLPERGAGERKTILMAGRADDPLKGMAVLCEAGRLLWRERQDFQMLVTHYDHGVQTPWLRCAGWRDHAGAMALYADADIVAVPSIWQEPFGLVAVEAMAHARPVVASEVGGLADIVRHGQTGYLVPPNDAQASAEHLRCLLDNADARRRMGEEGRRVAASEYDWQCVIDRHYRPLIEELIT